MPRPELKIFGTAPVPALADGRSSDALSAIHDYRYASTDTHLPIHLRRGISRHEQQSVISHQQASFTTCHWMSNLPPISSRTLPPLEKASPDPTAPELGPQGHSSARLYVRRKLTRRATLSR
ncbi:hypothetical protein CDD80_7564 [Ophiocordyceps camponoti-rufipedis]|uniref:Uncharacterized protein n=1 Tax=Ophiocordyceps camponoti-rufipedis TaxID=2004952 RepID=A0A2C5ZFI1_9HYPO|nr:hypothetical protein CDD80_7564 [Ophiocordyceps camponoti-rufipedis]